MTWEFLVPGTPRMVVHVVPVAELAETTAGYLANTLEEGLAERERLVLAVSGGSTPGPMFAHLFHRELDWRRIAIVQVDERLAPEDSPERNLTDLRRRLAGTPAEAADLHPMPVEQAEEGARRYAGTLRALAGDPPVIDVVQLGLGADGHVASLLPGDPVLQVADADVAMTRPYRTPTTGRHRRMTLTYPAINRARSLVWMVAGEQKAAAVQGLLAGAPELPASHIRRDGVVFADDASIGR